MIDRNTQVVGVSPRITAEHFAEILLDAKSPAAEDAFSMYDAVEANGIDPAFFLAIFKEESNFATDPTSMVVIHKTNNPGNCRSSSIGILPVKSTERGLFVIYPDWPTGADDATHRLTDSRFPYVQAKAKTIAQIIPIWAPAKDSNNPERYISNVVSFMNEWVGGSSMIDPTNKIDIVHANKGRGGASPEIIVIHVQEGNNDLPSFFRSSGDDSTIWCKQDGTLVRMEQDTDSAWTNGFMAEPIDHTNPHIQSLYNRGVRNSNNYALTIEHQGFAAGVFTSAAIESTAKMCAYWMLKYGWTDVDTRIVGHAAIGEHKNCPGPNFPWAKLRARVKDLIGGATVLTTDNHTPLPKPDANQINGHVLGGGFRAFYDKLAAVSPNFQLLVLGLPVSDEFDCAVNGDGKNYTVQLFERAGIIYEAANVSPWDVHLLTTSQLETALAAAKAKSLTN
jgi:hypothetical protein